VPLAGFVPPREGRAPALFFRVFFDFANAIPVQPAKFALAHGSCDFFSGINHHRSAF
jgi:hypothetical protein